MMYIVKKASIIICIIIISTTAHAEELITLSNGEWLPYLSKNLKHYGGVSQIVTQAFALEGVTVKYEFRPWKRAYMEAKEGYSNGSLVWSRTPEREQDFYYSDVVFEGQSVFFHLRTFPFDWATFDDLVDLKLGGSLGYKYNIESHPGIKIERASREELNFKKLLLGRIEIFLSDVDVGYEVLYQHFTTEKLQLITHHPKPFHRTEYHLILSRQVDDSRHFLELFNRGLKRLRESGKYDQYIEAIRKGEYKQL